MREPKDIGRPTELTPEVKEAILQAYGLGCYLETAAAYAGIGEATLRTWLRRGAKEIKRRKKYREEILDERELDAHRQRKIKKEERERREERDQTHKETWKVEQVYVDFRIEFDRVHAKAELADLGVISRVARGEYVTKRATRTDKDGATTTTETLGKPEWQAAAWRLERRSPQRWGKSQRIELAGDQDAPVAVTFADAIREAHDRKLIETTKKKSAPSREPTVLDVVPVKKDKDHKECERVGLLGTDD